MNSNKYIIRFCFFSIAVGVLHFVMETWFHITFEQSIVQLLADYIGIFMLVFSASFVLKKKYGVGLLCGAWGYSFCLNYRAFGWRMDAYTKGDTTVLLDTTLVVLLIALFFSLAAFIYTIFICTSSKN